ncbi:MAG: zinc dependent phospholipase C family protein [Tenericutes bacterium]|nr:zinc dependent phospholipase C family protein [Mycoplasmatota bacterium]MDD6941621.1 zinc dependent phospholipase C family protein [bacterium]MDY2697514.1 zinc dependent phospholipase C family protein [Bacilli bacterium]
MPATAVHAYFAQDLNDILPKEIKNKLDVDRLKTFGQSTDSLMFYNLFSILPGKNIRDFQKYFHTNKTQEFFINLINYIKENDYTEDIDVNSFLVGAICHYVLDSTVHPYIYYKTGYFNKNDKSTYKYNNVHTFMETFLDNDMIKRRESINPYKFNISKFSFDTSKFSNELNDTIKYTFKETFDVDNMDKIYYKSLKQMRNSIFIFRQDRYGIKKFFYKLADTFTSKRVFRFEAISYHYPLNDRHNFLNENHKLWRNPCDYSLTSEESFLDLYLKALKLAKVMICASFDYINGKDIELEKVFINKSYITGLDCELDKKLKYFEF